MPFYSAGVKGWARGHARTHARGDFLARFSDFSDPLSDTFSHFRPSGGKRDILDYNSFITVHTPQLFTTNHFANKCTV